MLETLRLSSLAFVFICFCWGCSSRTSESPTPGLQWPSAPPEEQGFDSAALAEVVEQIDQQDLPIDSMQVVRNGVLILDAYFYPYLGDGKHDVASVTKSVTSTLVGIAVDRGLLTLDQGLLASFPDLAPAPSSDGKADIDLRHLLTMTSGLDCGLSPGEPELYETLQSDHFVKYALELPMAAEVSGKVYRLAENQFGVSCISLRFDSPSEVWFDLTLGSDVFELPVGMDGVPRFSQVGPRGIPIGALGEWTADTVFSMHYDEVAGPSHLRIEGDFGASADSVQLEFTDPSGYFGAQTVQGSAVASCN